MEETNYCRETSMFSHQYLAGVAGNSCVTECFGMFSVHGTISWRDGVTVEIMMNTQTSDFLKKKKNDSFCLSGSGLLSLASPFNNKATNTKSACERFYSYN